ncbi:MAG: cytidine deaminase family protein [Janthinobacterium lividum]
MQMIDKTVIGSLIQSASEMLARSGDGDNHPVAASIYADDSAIYSGMNLYHFTGGPCAEIVALARLASDGGGAKALAIVAVADRDRGVIAPCGRCRQILTDYYPEIQVILSIEDRIRAVRLTELLPHGYLRVARPEITRNIQDSR